MALARVEEGRLAFMASGRECHKSYGDGVHPPNSYRMMKKCINF
jgi:hypothetical protein